MDAPVLSPENIDIFHLRRTVDSTQDEAKRLLDTYRPKCSLAVIADNQRKGRGTSGRSWVATEGNLFLSVAIPMNSIPRSKVTLLPLGVGLIIAQTVRPQLTTRPTVKWPNDVLIDGMKIAGTLIENYRSDQNEFWLVGVGVNVRSSPHVLNSEPKDFRSMPRTATHLQRYANPSQDLFTAFDVGVELATGLQEWVSGLESLDAVDFTSSWKSWADFSADYELRETGERVKILDIEQDGQLRVLDAFGNQRLLVADYFF
jgi:biotin-[acetyl-CoA-carboxylase] ligase BirA-like protein